MKVLKLMLCFTVIILTVSCDEDNDIVQDEIVAVWNLTSIEEQGVDTPASGCELSHTITFSADNSGNNIFPENEPNEPCDFETLEFTWTQNGDQLVFDVVFEGIIRADILQLTSSILEITVTENDGTTIGQAERRIFKYQK